MRESGTLVKAESAEATRAFGARLGAAFVAARLDQPFVLGLRGDLGAGKTTLVGGMLAALGHEGVARSPTYSLIEPYRLAGRDVYHCDLYRLRDPTELDDLGLRDLLVGPCLLLIEWPERAGDRLRGADLDVMLAYADEGRHLCLAPRTTAGRAVLDALG